MKASRRFLVVLVLLPVICLAGQLVLPRECYYAMQQVDNFQELRSDTNLPPAVLSSCKGGNTWRHLLWAVTDGKHYVVHQQYVPSGFSHTNYLLLVAWKPDTNSPSWNIAPAGYMHSFADYRSFVKQMVGPFLGEGY